MNKMDTVKEYLPFGNSAAIVATAIYFHRRCQEQEEQIAQLVEGIKILHKKITNAEKNANRTLKEMNERVLDVERSQRRKTTQKSEPEPESKSVSWGGIKSHRYENVEDDEMDDLTEAMAALMK